MNDEDKQLEYRVYEELNAALEDHELNRANLESRTKMVHSGDWREGFTRGFMESLQQMQNRLNILKYQASMAPEFIFQIDMRPPKCPNVCFVCTISYHKDYQFEKGVRHLIKTRVPLNSVYSKLLADFPIELSTFEVGLQYLAYPITSPQFDSVQYRALYELDHYGGLICVFFGIFNAEKYPAEIDPNFPKLFLWAEFDARNMGEEIIDG